MIHRDDLVLIGEGGDRTMQASTSNFMGDGAKLAAEMLAIGSGRAPARAPCAGTGGDQESRTSAKRRRRCARVRRK